MGPFAQAIPIEGLVGGLMIGLAAAIMLLGAGRIASVATRYGRRAIHFLDSLHPPVL